MPIPSSSGDVALAAVQLRPAIQRGDVVGEMPRVIELQLRGVLRAGVLEKECRMTFGKARTIFGFSPVVAAGSHWMTSPVQAFWLCAAAHVPSYFARCSECSIFAASPWQLTQLSSRGQLHPRRGKMLAVTRTARTPPQRCSVPFAIRGI
jgi:hypothetical protein